MACVMNEGREEGGGKGEGGEGGRNGGREVGIRRDREGGDKRRKMTELRMGTGK